MIKVKNLTVKFKNKKIIDSLDFEIKSGKLTSIIGPNGSGKSTLIKALSGDLNYTGKIFFNGVDLKNVNISELAFQRSVLQQKSYLAFPFTVYEVIQIGIQKTVKFNIDELIYKTLKLLNLENFINKNFYELSGGEQQRAQIARTLAQLNISDNNEKKWIFLDEPISNLDIKNQLEVMNIIKKFSNSGGGVIVVMHDLNLSSIFSDEILLLKEGVKLGIGSPENIIVDHLLSEAYECKIKVKKTLNNSLSYIIPHFVELKKYDKFEQKNL